MGRRSGKGSHDKRVVCVTTACIQRTTKKYDCGLGANCWKEVWADESEVAQARAQDQGAMKGSGLVQTYHDAQKKKAYRLVHCRTLRAVC